MSRQGPVDYVCYGIDYREVKDGFEDGLKGTADIKINGYVEKEKKPIATNYGFGPVLAALPYTDDNRRNKIAGNCRRVLRAPPKHDKIILLEFKIFVMAFITENFRPIDADADVSFTSWIFKTPYPERRKQQLTAIYESLNENEWMVTKHRVCKCFAKWEHYTDYKHSRGIMSRTDEAKVMLAPIFKLIEKEVFALAPFIKKIPVSDRPNYIVELLGTQGPYGVNDFTAFESLFVGEVMQACELQLYKYMGQNFPNWVELVVNCLAGTNVMKYKEFTAYVEACRMSGEMCTSLGNGFSNLMFLLFMSHKSGSDWRSVKCVIEGDDSLFTLPEKFDQSLYGSLGLRSKLEVHDSINEASFCGIIFDEEDKLNLTDPRKVFAGIGWGPMKYHKSRKSTKISLLRAKALSFAHQYPGCPIVDVLAHRLLYLTRSHKVKSTGFDYYKQQMLLDDPICEKDLVRKGATPSPMRSRLLVEKLFNITIEQQIAIEANIMNMELEICDDSIFLDTVPSSWIKYADKYVWPIDRKGEMPYLHEVSDAYGHRSSINWLLEAMRVMGHGLNDHIPNCGAYVENGEHVD